MANNKVDRITEFRTLDGVLQQNTNNVWQPVIQSISNKTSGFTLELSDVGKYIRVNSATDVVVTVPDLNFPTGACISFEQVGAGTITITAGTGVTVNGEVISGGQYKVIQIIKVSFKEWTVVGGTS